MIERVTLVGCGAVGLPLAVALAHRGVVVEGVDSDPARLARLGSGDPGQRDEGLAEALVACLDAGRLRFAPAVSAHAGPTAWILAVPTPVDDRGLPVIRYLDDAVAALDAVMADGDRLAVRATVPIGTSRRLATRLSRPGRRVAVASCPDRSIAGRAFLDQLSIPSVIGGVAEGDTEALAEVFAPLGRVETVSAPEAAEALKMFANVYRDVRFAMANEMALVCEAAGVDFTEIARVGAIDYGRFDPGRPGPVGGPCLTKDVYLLASGLTAMPPRLGLAARDVNAALLDWADREVSAALADRAGPVSVAVLGLGFKGVPETSDRRHSVGVQLAERLSSQGLAVRTWDPLDSSPLDAALDGVDVVVLANDHPALRQFDQVAWSTGPCADAVLIDLCGGPTMARGPVPAGRRLVVFGDGAAARTTGAG